MNAKRKTQSSSTLTKNAALNAAKKIINEWDAWLRQEGPTRSWQGEQVKIVSAQLDYTIRTECDSTADAEFDDVEEAARGLVLRLDEVAYTFQRWVQNASMSLRSAPPWGSDELHRVIDHLRNQLRKSNLPPPPPIEQLNRQNVSPVQIANMYGWKNEEDGSADVQRVFEEMSKPGTQFDPKTWVHPSEAVALREINENWKARQPREKLFPLDSSEQQPRPKPEPMTMDQLIDARAPVEQIMRLTGMDEDIVLDRAKEMGVELTERFIRPATPGAALQEQMEQASQSE